jgi:hypothetical protein
MVVFVLIGAFALLAFVSIAGSLASFSGKRRL